jgi:hypothetical protein
MIAGQPRGVMQPQRGPTRVRQHHPLASGWRGLQMMGQLGQPHLKIRMIRLGELRHVDVAADPGKLSRQP